MNDTWTRRRFVMKVGQAAAVAAFATASRRLQASPAEPSGGNHPSLTVVDTHTHFYDPARPAGVPWPPRDDALLYRTVLPKDYRSLAVPHPVFGTVVVEASSWLEDNQWVLDLASKEPFIVGYVGNLPIGTKQFSGHLKRFAVNQVFRGIRIRDRRTESILDDAAALSDLKLLAEHNLSVDLVGGSEILDFAARLSKELPGLRIIVDHLAGVRIDGKAPPADWVGKMKVLAARPGVYFKVSGLVEGTGRTDGSAPRDVSYYRPVLDEMWRMFGPERLIYASNWPVSERFAPLATVQGIVEDYVRSHGVRAEEQVFALTSKAAYRWENNR